jgi:hypothetical protein
LLATFVVMCLGLVAVAFAAGRFVRSSSDLPTAMTTTAGPVYAPVAERVVETLPARDGIVRGRDLMPVPAPRLDEDISARSVVTRVTVRAGDTVRPGRVLSVVSGRPVFLLRLPVPLHRSLRDGDTGDDVRELQQALAEAGLYRSGTDGRFGPATQAAVARLYHRAGFEALRELPAGESGAAGTTAVPHGTVSTGPTVPEPVARVRLPMDEVFGIAQKSAVVADVTPVGTILSADGAPVAQLRVGGLVVRARIGVDEREAYPVGTRLRIGAPDLTAKSWLGEVTAVSGFRQTPDDPDAGSSTGGTDATTPAAGGPAGATGDLPGYDITVRVDGDPEELGAGRRVTVVPIRATAAPTLAVPLVAIRQDSEGTYVIAEDGRRVAVEVISDADGWAAIAEGPLRKGDKVQVSP